MSKSRKSSRPLVNPYSVRDCSDSSSIFIAAIQWEMKFSLLLLKWISSACSRTETHPKYSQFLHPSPCHCSLKNINQAVQIFRTRFDENLSLFFLSRFHQKWKTWYVKYCASEDLSLRNILDSQISHWIQLNRSKFKKID